MHDGHRGSGKGGYKVNYQLSPSAKAGWSKLCHAWRRVYFFTRPLPLRVARVPRELRENYCLWFDWLTCRRLPTLVGQLWRGRQTKADRKDSLQLYVSWGAQAIFRSLIKSIRPERPQRIVILINHPGDPLSSPL